MNDTRGPCRPDTRFTLRAVLLVLAVAGVAGCSSLQIMENRIACSTDLAELFFVSRYGTIGISADVSQKDARRTCEALLMRQLLDHQGDAVPPTKSNAASDATSRR